MDKARSRDATEIAFERLGEGWPVILVSGATTDRAIHASLAELLATRLHHAQLRPSGPRRQRRHPAVRGRARNRGHRRRDRHSRRIGRGLRQLLGRGSRHASCGGGPITRLMLWDPPFFVDPRRHQEYVTRLTELLAAGRRGDAMVLFMTTVGPRQHCASQPGLLRQSSHVDPDRQQSGALGGQCCPSAHRQAARIAPLRPRRPEPRRGLGCARPRAEGVLQPLSLTANPLTL